MSHTSRFDRALSLIDAAHAEDSRQSTLDGKSIPTELLYARRLSGWLDRLHPDAGESLRLAVRAQHLRRWRIPRDQYPMDRAGYLKWRKDLAQFHAQQAGELLQQAGYEPDAIGRIQSLIRREKLKLDAESQAVEDVACLDFMEHDLAEFAVGRDQEQMRTILTRTWAKMSPQARQAALSIQLPSAIRSIINSLPTTPPATSPAPAASPSKPPGMT
ncbi:MAG: DUF4202 domain-containing protein [Phycisphaerales bacterium]|nr:DUF4202 domain-containing protein [Phycisphaerales bacterium]